jgi:RNA polymerase sigma-70 factor (ECF subfamily)
MAMPRLAVAAKRVVPGPHGRTVADTEAKVEATLVAGAAEGDAAAFRALVERHLSGILAVARRMLRDDAEAEDVAQETMLRLWRSADALEVGPHGLRPWLRRVVSNLCVDRMRSGRRLTVVDEVPERAEPATQQAHMEADEVSRRVDEALKELPDRQRMALTLFHYEGLSQVEVGRIMGVSDEAVESLLARARRSLKAALRDEWRELLASEDPL